MFCSEEESVECRQNHRELQCSLCFHIKREFSHLEPVNELQGAWEAPETIWHIFVCIYENFSGESMTCFYQLSKWLGTSKGQESLTRAPGEAVCPPCCWTAAVPSATWGEGPTFWTPVTDLCPHPHAVPSNRIGLWQEQRAPELQTGLCFQLVPVSGRTEACPISFHVRTVSPRVSRYRSKSTLHSLSQTCCHFHYHFLRVFFFRKVTFKKRCVWVYSPHPHAFTFKFI